MANRHRGEVGLDLGGTRYTLRFTLGALAELEDSLQAGDIVAVAERFGNGRPSARDLIALLGAGLRGGGHAIDDEAVARLPLAGDVTVLTQALGEALAAAFGPTPETPEPDPR